MRIRLHRRRVCRYVAFRRGASSTETLPSARACPLKGHATAQVKRAIKYLRLFSKLTSDRLEYGLQRFPLQDEQLLNVDVQIEQVHVSDKNVDAY